MSRKTLVVALLVVVVSACANRPSPVAEVSGAPAGLEGSPEADAAMAPAGPPPIELLRAWDAQRAEAWARGDPRLLRPLYTRGSVAGRRDRAMLRAWAERGLAIRDLGTQLLSVRVLAHTRRSWTLRVTDRLIGGTTDARGAPRPLPRDAATARTVELRLVDGRWRVAGVAP